MTRYPHSIRLHGPWEFEVVSGAAESPRGRAKLPGDWSSHLGAKFCGQVRYRRAFHRPSGLDAQEHVWLVCEGVDAWGEIACNGQSLGAVALATPREFEITQLLTSHNEVLLDVELPQEKDRDAQLRPGRELLPGGPIGEVRLEIRERQFLSACDFRWTMIADQPTLFFTGCVSGETADAPLELVVRGPERELHYSLVTVGVPFAVTIPSVAADDGPLELQVRLIRGATRVWEATQIVMFQPEQPR